MDVQVYVRKSCHVNILISTRARTETLLIRARRRKKSKVRDQQEQRGNVVTETVFAGER